MFYIHLWDSWRPQRSSEDAMRSRLFEQDPQGQLESSLLYVAALGPNWSKYQAAGWAPPTGPSAVAWYLAHLQPGEKVSEAEKKTRLLRTVGGALRRFNQCVLLSLHLLKHTEVFRRRTFRAKTHLTRLKTQCSLCRTLKENFCLLYFCSWS